MKNFLKTSIPACIILLSLMMSGIQVFAQKPGDNQAKIRQKLNAHKIAFLTERLQLTESEAEKFWPLYRTYEEERKNLREDLFLENLNADLSEKDAEKALDNMIDLRTKDLELQKKYVSRFRNVLSAKKVIDLFRAEKEFKARMVEKIRERPNKRGR